MSQFFVSGGQSIGASASASVLPKKIQRYSETVLYQTRKMVGFFNKSEVFIF